MKHVLMYQTQVHIYQIYDTNGIDEIATGSGVVTSNSICIWDGTGANYTGTYYILATFFNECGQKNDFDGFVDIVLSKNSTKNENESAEISTTEVSISQYDNQFRIYPVPNTGKFSTQTDNILPFSICIYNINGVLVYQKNDIIRLQNILLENAKAGTYLIHIKQGNKIYNKPIIIKE